jgi:hypothetical protein
MILDGSNGVTFNDASLQGAAASPFGLKNRIINGDMVIDQRNAGASLTINSTTSGTYSVDRFNAYCQQTSGAFTVQQSTTVPTLTRGAFTNSLLFTVTNTTAPGSTNRVLLRQIIEGLNVADFGWGTSSATSITLSFWVRSSIIGTYGVGFINSAENRSYVGTYTISSANTWEQKTITVAGDTTGTWLTNNSNGIRVAFDLGSGTGYNASSANTWVAQEACRTSSCVNWQQNSGATFYITGVQLERNTTATPFEWLPYGTELALCQRYFELLGGRNAYEPVGAGFIFSSTTGVANYFFKQTMRTAPSLTVPTASNWSVMNNAGSGIGLASLVINDSGNQVTVNGVCLRFQVPSGLTAGNATSLESVNTNARINLSAEL